jgi:hypothetical protein
MPPYPIQLLNDLHEHFPDILYNPERFQNVQDLLLYIRQVASINPYMSGRNLYRTYTQQPTVSFNNISSLISSVINEMMSDDNAMDNTPTVGSTYSANMNQDYINDTKTINDTKANKTNKDNKANKATKTNYTNYLEKQDGKYIYKYDHNY